jgi:dTDP-4-dehydrorhamnose reductase
MTNNILILGKGYIGRAVQKRLQCDIKSSGEMDYHNPAILRKYLLNNGVKIVINCSGFTGRPNVDEAELKKELCWDLNVISPLRVNRVCNELDIKYVHVSSGCIYDGYFKEWEEGDVPNFGLFQQHSSFYSKSKHAFETVSKDLAGVILRIRMPLGHETSSRDYLAKIRNYDNLIDYRNSKTYIPDLCEVIHKLCYNIWIASNRQIINVVNPSPLNTSEVCEIMKKYGYHNDNWNFVSLSDLKISTGRSNCVLNPSSVMSIHRMMDETEAIERILQDKQEQSILNREEQIARISSYE